MKDPAVHQQVLRRLTAFWAENGWEVSYLSFSPITGGEGNIEYLAALSRRDTTPAAPWQGDIRALTLAAKQAFSKKGGRTT